MEHARPNRSDAHLSEEEAAKVAAATREYFDEVVPKRHTKPQRSEYSSAYADALSSNDDNIPEYVQFQNLEKDDQKMVYSGGKAGDEFTETEYYKDLNGVDKQHHMTGTGFIKVESKDGKAFSLVPDSDIECHAPGKGNPATNDWIPNTTNTDTVDSISGKPNRSG